MEIDITKYLSDDEIQSCILQEIRTQIRGIYNSESDVQRLVSNLTYKIVFDMVDPLLEGGLENFLREKVKEKIENLSSYEIFRRADAWERSASKAQEILDDESEKARPLIRERVEKIIAEHPFDTLKRDEIGDVVYQCIMDRLFGDKK